MLRISQFKCRNVYSIVVAKFGVESDFKVTLFLPEIGLTALRTQYVNLPFRAHLSVVQSTFSNPK